MLRYPTAWRYFSFSNTKTIGKLKLWSLSSLIIAVQNVSLKALRIDFRLCRDPNTVECNYLSLPLIPTSGTTLLTWLLVYLFNKKKTCWEIIVLLILITFRNNKNHLNQIRCKIRKLSLSMRVDHDKSWRHFRCRTRQMVCHAWIINRDPVAHNCPVAQQWRKLCYATPPHGDIFR